VKGLISTAEFLKVMVKMLTCPCGWTVMSPQGEEDVKKHAAIHMRDAHPGAEMTEEEIRQNFKSV
jgi:predicted small metal-binding protein